MFPVLQIGPLAIQTPGLVLILGVWFGLTAAERFARQRKNDANPIYNLVLLGLLVGILGARLAYALQYFAIFTADPLSLFSLSPTMLNPEAGLTAGCLAALIYANRKSLPLWPTLDNLAAGSSVFLIAWHLANFASGNAYGSPSGLPWAIDLWGERRHPVQIYEMTAAIVITLMLMLKSPLRLPGLTFWLWVALSSLARLFFDYFRGDSFTWIANLHSDQLIAWIAACIALWQIGRMRRQIPPIADMPDSSGENSKLERDSPS